eukprot:1184925-Prorocentrum_minimum.AAC.3
MARALCGSLTTKLLCELASDVDHGEGALARVGERLDQRVRHAQHSVSAERAEVRARGRHRTRPNVRDLHTPATFRSAIRSRESAARSRNKHAQLRENVTGGRFLLGECCLGGLKCTTRDS